MRSTCSASNFGLYFNYWDHRMGTNHPTTKSLPRSDIVMTGLSYSFYSKFTLRRGISGFGL